MAEEKKQKEYENGEVTAAAAAAEAAEAEELPKTIVRRLVKEKLSQISTANSEVSVFSEALQAFSESGRLFIHYLTATANDVCKDSNRQIINSEDVFKALEEIDFAEFVQPLRASLEQFRQRNAGRRSASSKAKEADRKGKRKEPPAADVEDEQNGAISDKSEEGADG